MNHGSLFSGIGGFDLASHWMGWKNVFQIEKDEWCKKVLKKNFPEVKRYSDIKKFNGEKYKGSIDVISGGFPCQPFSTAGKQLGKKDNRFLWPEMLRVIREIKPFWVIGENVAGIISLENGKTLETIFNSLENEGYEVEAFIIPACGVGAWHRRDRIWIIANAGHTKPQERRKSKTDNEGSIKEWIKTRDKLASSRGIISNNTNSRNEGMYKRKNISNKREWDIEPKLDRVAHGIPRRVDRIRGLGNAIVPHIAHEIFKAINEINETSISTTNRV